MHRDVVERWTQLFGTPPLISRFVSGKSEEGEPSAPTCIPLRAFACSGESSAIPYAFADYLELVDWTGRCVRADKRGFISDHLPPIARRLGIDAEAWQRAMRPRGNVFGRAMGRLDHLRLHAKTLGQSWIGSMHAARTFFL
jgi:hypothetical protein